MNSLRDEDYQLSDSSLGQSFDEAVSIDYARYEKEDYVRRKKEYETFMRNRQVEDLSVGQLVDVRTPEFV